MKITSSPPPSLPLPTDSSLASASPSEVAPQDLEMLQEDAVQLSQVSSLSDTDGMADVDLEKVAALTQAIAEGSFEIDSHTIYTSLVADAKEMQGSEPT
ncbi:flagellar biosynthesis anti-sigma factor FlgM [Pseudomonas sp. Teo4]|uniref:flagellar biosynthesis anti-sigma factor FlgM n=1 Tax=Pseudomonas sp. Teo4 TaxID=3064528 RepID=UPI002ABB3B15|nr:flagellar biosynthesis anti-sigma factor FlgM [Pseudomonas sp. Teo4]MDZ3995116.1 hypothetical protein [Pseudomonas sp. Teo4]